MSTDKTQVKPLDKNQDTAPITVGDLIAEFLAHIGVRRAYGVISIHNMPILDGFHTRGQIRFVSARGEAGACNMADADARVSASLGVVVTSTGTGAGNAAGALVEALTAGTPLLHLTGQIEAAYLDRDLGFIHEAKDQLAMLRAVGKDAFRISQPSEALAVLEKAVTLAFTAPCGPVSIECAIDVQKMLLERPAYPSLQNLLPAPIQPNAAQIAALVEALKTAQRPLLWLGGGARAAGAAVARLVKLGFGVVTSVQGRGVVDETHPPIVSHSLGAFNLQKAAQDLYAQCDAMVVVGSRLRSNETLSYKLTLPKKLWRIDANPALQTQAHPYAFEAVIQGDAALSLDLLADALEHNLAIASDWHAAIEAARKAAEAQVDSGLAAYLTLKNELNAAVQALPTAPSWVRDITLSNTMWGNRSLSLKHPLQGVHALGGGIGQGMQMAIGAAIGSGRKAIALCGDGGFMLNVGELACAVQERADVLLIVMNDACYGVIKNIQDADYGSRHAYVALTTPDFAQLCASLNVPHYLLSKPADTCSTLDAALAQRGPVMVEVDMNSWGDFAVKFAGPPRKAS